jgi:hypothetical protein
MLIIQALQLVNLVTLYVRLALNQVNALSVRITSIFIMKTLNVWPAAPLNTMVKIQVPRNASDALQIVIAVILPLVYSVILTFTYTVLIKNAYLNARPKIRSISAYSLLLHALTVWQIVITAQMVVLVRLVLILMY